MKNINLLSRICSLLLLVGFLSFDVLAQDPSAILDLESTTQGLLAPRMTTVEKNAIVSPAQSLLVYDTDTKSFWYYDDSAWNEAGAGGGGGLWTLDGDDLVRNEPGSVVSIGASPDDQSALYVEAPGPGYGADTTAIYGYRRGSSTSTGGTSWAVSQVASAVKGYSFYGNAFSAGVAGFSDLDYNNSAALVGAAYNGSTWAALGYKDNNGKIWGGYIGAGDLYVEGNVGIGTNTQAPFAQLSMGLYDSGSSGDSIQLLLSGQHNSGTNKGSSSGTYKLKIEGHNNDLANEIVYPIHVSDENGNVDFYLENSRAVGSTPPKMYVAGTVGVGTETPEADLHIVGNDTLGSLMIAPDESSVNDDSKLFLAEDNDGTYGMGIKYDGGENQLYIYGKASSTISAPHLSINRDNGNIAIGATDGAANYKLSVDGKIACEEVLVQLSGAWPDYVFTSDYNLKTLNEVKQHIAENGHLPGVPSAKEVGENGIAVGEMNKVLMEKIEELTLYILHQEERLKAVEATINK